MPRIAPLLRAAVLLLGVAGWPAESPCAEEFDEPAQAQATSYLAECSPDSPAGPRESRRRMRFDSSRGDRDPEPQAAGPPDLGLDAPIGSPMDMPPDPPFDLPLDLPLVERTLDLPSGAATDWCGPGPTDLPTALDEAEAGGLTVRERFWWELGNLWQDYGNYYFRWQTYCKLAVAFGVGGALANTRADESVENWYESHIRNNATDHASTFFRGFGAGYYAIPAWFGVGLLGAYFDESPWGNVAAQFGFQTTRAILVGAPALLLAQSMTGGSRPDEPPYDSHWHPFKGSHGVSGHAYIGAIPFLTAAGMADSLWLKALFYAASITPGWSRLDDNVHFLSQVILGWCMAYIACDAVAETEATTTSVSLTPVVSDRMTGIGLLIQY